MIDFVDVIKNIASHGRNTTIVNAYVNNPGVHSLIYILSFNFVNAN